MFQEFAPAKINLFLHVLGRRQDGYHHLESLVSFADIGDELTLEPGDRLALSVAGPFAHGLDGDDNLVLKAFRAYTAVFGKARAGHFVLTKKLPVASGIGGGSSDAAAALRLLAHANGIALDDPRLMDAAMTLGADVPVCLDAGALRMMQGIGHELGNKLYGFRYPALLVNPGEPVETRSVFTQLGLMHGERFLPPQAPGPDAAQDAPGMLADTRNDLEAPAIMRVPSIADVLGVLRAAAGCRFARMSGSGATCFGIFDSLAEAEAARVSIAASQPAWWVAATTIKLPG